MQFLIKPKISDAGSLNDFFSAWKVGAGDLLISNEFVLLPALQGGKPPCDVLYQEKFGTGEPNDIMIDAMLAAMKDKDFKRIIAVGGGTVIDIAKLFIFEGYTDVEELFKNGPALKKCRDLVIIPTTCGTGSEVTCISIVGFEKKKTKAGLALPVMFADEVVLIESMLATLPYNVFATSSIDALIHAIESYVSPKANEFTRLFSRAASGKILKGYRRVVKQEDRKRIENIGTFLLASTYAGIAFGNAGVGAVHALSYPLGGTYHVPHGKANYLVFAKVFAKYKSLGADLRGIEEVLAEPLDCGVADVWTELVRLIDDIFPNEPLGGLGITKDVCKTLAESVIANQQRLLVNDPVVLSVRDIEEIYLSCL